MRRLVSTVVLWTLVRSLLSGRTCGRPSCAYSRYRNRRRQVLLGVPTSVDLVRTTQGPTEKDFGKTQLHLDPSSSSTRTPWSVGYWESMETRPGNFKVRYIKGSLTNHKDVTYDVKSNQIQTTLLKTNNPSSHRNTFLGFETVLFRDPSLG